MLIHLGEDDLGSGSKGDADELESSTDGNIVPAEHEVPNEEDGSDAERDAKRRRVDTLRVCLVF